MKSNYSQSLLQLLLALVVLGLPIASQADSGPGSKWFVDVSLLNNSSSGEISAFTLDDDSETGVSLGVGYSFNRYFDVQVDYSDLGEHFATDCPPPLVCIITNIDKVDLDAFSVTAKGKWPVNEMLDVYAKVGIAHWSADFQQFARDDSDNDAVYGVGAALRFTPNWQLNVHYDEINLDVQSYGLGLQYRF